MRTFDIPHRHRTHNVQMFPLCLHLPLFFSNCIAHKLKAFRTRGEAEKLPAILSQIYQRRLFWGRRSWLCFPQFPFSNEKLSQGIMFLERSDIRHEVVCLMRVSTCQRPCVVLLFTCALGQRLLRAWVRRNRLIARQSREVRA